MVKGDELDANWVVGIVEVGVEEGGPGAVAGSSGEAQVEAQGTINYTATEFERLQELRRLAKAVVAPTSDDDVRLALRYLEEPVTYFGEDRVDRRDRLQDMLAKRLANGDDCSFIVKYGGSLSGSSQDVEMAEEDDEDDEEFYTPGDETLYHARKSIAEFSVGRAKARIDYQKKQFEIPLTRHVKLRRDVNDRLKQLDSYGQQSGFDRPVSAVKMSPDSSLIAVGDWSGSIKVLSATDMNPVLTCDGGHTEKVGGVAWHPDENSHLDFISGGLEGNVQLWSLKSNKPIGTLTGHEARVCKVDVHPTGRYAGSASFDYTWRLWDLETQKELLIQEGHSKEVFAVKFQGDGALAGSAGLDAIGRIWDLRTGKTIMILDGHIREIYSMDFSPNGYQVATGSADNSVIIWDLRQVKSLFTIPAHTKMVSDVKFFQGRNPLSPQSGSFLATSSYDNSVKLWSSDNWTLQHTLADTEKILSIDISNDMESIVAGRWDRYVKLYKMPEHL